MGFKKIKEGEFTKAKCCMCKFGKVKYKEMGAGYCKECKEKMEEHRKSQDYSKWKVASTR